MLRLIGMPPAGDTTARVEESRSDHSQQAPLRLAWLLGGPAQDAPLISGQVVGRAPHCALRIDGHGVSREHAEVNRQGPLWVIRDLSSTNGTHVNGRRVQHAPLSEGDILRLGHAVALVARSPFTDLRASEIAPGLVAGPELATLLGPLRAAATTRDLPIVISGATGTGKERVARAVHEWSGRAGPFHAINCAAIPERMAEAELFGYRRGAFTGAQHAHDGHLRAASGGTLFLDEIAELSLELQAKLLRAIEERAVMPIGESKAVPVDLRVVCATQRPLDAMVAAGQFREDLCARLSGLAIDLPLLRKRRADIVSLFHFFLKREAPTDTPELDSKFVEALCLYDWPKNVRELELLVRRTVALNPGERVLKRSHLPAEVTSVVDDNDSEREREEATFASRDEQDLHRIVIALRESGGNVKAAAAQVGISRQRVYRLLAGRDVGALLEAPPDAKRSE